MKSTLSLKDFFTGLSGKAKLIIYILSLNGFTYEQVRVMTVGDLQSFRGKLDKSAPDLLDLLDDLTVGRDVSENAFQYKSGRPYPSSRIQDILIRAHERVGVEYRGLKHFQELFHRKK